MSDNVAKNRVLKMLQDHKKDPEYHPLCEMLDLVDEKDATIPDKINIHKSIARYVESELKAVEVTNRNTAPIKMSIDLTGNPIDE